MVELDYIHSTEGEEDMPPPDASGPIIPTYVPDEETRAAAEVLKCCRSNSQQLIFPKAQVDTPW